jgi:K+-transporting ATPase KdpF subunit
LHCVGRAAAMTWLHLAGGLIAILLLAYLTVALLWPEKFP